MINKFLELGIQVKGNKIQQTTICPKCSHTRKPENKKTPCLSIDLITGKYTCHHCGWAGWVNKKKVEKEITPNISMSNKSKFHPLNELAISYLKSRGISKEAIDLARLKQFNDWIIFPYFKEEKVLTYKKRCITTKQFSQKAGGTHIVYNYDRCKGQK